MTPTQNEPVVFRIFLADGAPDGLRIVEKTGWIGCAAVFPRSRFTQVKGLPQLNRTGVYVLLGDHAADPQEVYIGEGDPVIERLIDHFRHKDFWSSAVVFTSRDDTLHKAHLQNLEATLVRLAKQANRCKLMNVNTPDVPSLSQMDQAETKLYLTELLTVLDLLGIGMFKRPIPASEDAAVYHIDSKGLAAHGYEADAGFVVRAKSESPRAEAPSCPASIASVRAALRQKSVLVDGAGNLFFTDDYLFTSPSQAASVILGRAANGRMEWKTPDGRCLKEMQEKALER